MPKSKINIALLTQHFENNSDQVFAQSDLQFLLVDKAHEWNLPTSMSSKTFLQMLLTRTKLKQLRLQSPHYAPLIRYSWGDKPSSLSVAISIKKQDAFFSHASAMWIHPSVPTSLRQV